MVEVNQTAHTQSRSDEILVTDIYGATVSVNSYEYGRGTILGPTYSEQLLANVDLSHTPFVVDEETLWQVWMRAEGQQLRHDLFEDDVVGQSIDLRLPRGIAESRDVTVHHGANRLPSLFLRYLPSPVVSADAIEPRQPEEL